MAVSMAVSMATWHGLDSTRPSPEKIANVRGTDICKHTFFTSPAKSTFASDVLFVRLIVCIEASLSAIT